MPVYEYRCPQCTQVVCLHRSVESRKPAPTCECGEEMELKVAPATLVFKGPGFHSVDYRGVK